MEPTTEPGAAYRPEAIQQYFDQFGVGEWERLTRTPVDEVSLHVHLHYLEKYIRPDMRVLEIGAGAGRFTQALARLGARVVVGDLSAVQVDLNRRFAKELGFAAAVEDWQQVDLCDLSRFDPASFDAVLAYGGPFSYVLDRRDAALAECARVLRPGGLLLLSVMMLWGSAHGALEGVLLGTPIAANQQITRTGDITPATFPERQSNFMHLFRAREVSGWLARGGFAVLDRSASNCLSLTWKPLLEQVRGRAEVWAELLRMEIDACAEEGCLDLGTHLIAVARRDVD